MVNPSASVSVPIVVSLDPSGTTTAARVDTDASATVPSGRRAAAGFELTVVARRACDAHSHVAGGTPSRSIPATIAVRGRVLMNHCEGTGISSCLAAARTIFASTGE